MIYAMINWVCWGAFVLMWLGGAVYNAINGPRVLRKKTGFWGSWAIGIVIVWCLVRYDPYLWAKLRLNVPWLQIAGAVLLIVSTLFTLWSRLVLGAMWSSAPSLKQDHQLRTDGPYRITRHPIYTGMLGMLAGSALTSMIGLPVLLFFLAILLIKIPYEEKLMIEQFGEQYLDYKKRTTQLIPGLHIR